MPLHHTRLPSLGAPHPKFDEVIGQSFIPAAVGDIFGPSWSTHWFRVDMRVPDDWVGVEGPLLFSWDSGSEAMVWSVDGQPQQVRCGQRGHGVECGRPATVGEVRRCGQTAAAGEVWAAGPALTPLAAAAITLGVPLSPLQRLP